MPQETLSLVLSFSVPSEGRKEPFTREMEMAAVFCVAELERKKGGGIVLKQPQETVAFLSEASYPLILIPWEHQTLVFDALNTTAQPATYRAVPDVEEFLENLRSRSKTLETHMAFLSDNENFFRQPQSEQRITLNGLVVDPSLLSELGAYLDEARQTDSIPTERIIPSVVVNEDIIDSAKQELENLQSKLKKDLDSLYASVKLLGRTSEGFLKTLRTETKTVQDEYGERIREQEKIVGPDVSRTSKEYDLRIIELSRKFEKELAPLQKERAKLDKASEQTRAKMEQYKTEAKSSSSRKDRAAERRWKEKASEAKEKLSHLQKKIKGAKRRLQETEEKKSLEIINLRSESDTRIADAKRPILELEATRDAKIDVYKGRMDEIKILSAALAEQISATAKLRETDLAELAKLGIQQKRGEQITVNLPFYVACYQSEKGRRYLVVPPSVANNVGLAVKLKGALGQAKVRHLLSPRFKTVATFLGRVPLLLEQNPVLEREVYEQGERNNLLGKKPAHDQIKSGVDQIKQEGWLSEKEYEVFSQQPT